MGREAKSWSRRWWLAAALVAFGLVAPASAWAAGTIKTTPNRVDFSPPAVMVGLGGPAKKVVVENSGNAPLKLGSMDVQSAQRLDFALSSGGCPPVLAPQQSCEKFVEFRPLAPGSRTADLVITSNDPLTPSLHVPITGDATASAPRFSVSPSALDFGSLNVGTTAPPQRLDGISLGTQILHFSGASISPPGEFSLEPPTDCGLVDLAAANSGQTRTCVAFVTFTPSAGGPRTATLSFATNDPKGVTNVALRGTGTVPIPIATVDHTSIDFGSVLLGDSQLGQRQKSVTVTNVGSAPLTVAWATTSGTTPTDFTVLSGPPCSGGPCIISIQFKARGFGARSATLTIRTNDPANPNLQVALKGFGEISLPIAPGPAPPDDVLFCSAAVPAAGALPTCVISPPSCSGAGQPAMVTIPVTRAFASRNPGTTLPQPTLAAAVASGAMGAATLEIMTLNLGPTSVHAVALNGTAVGTMTLAGNGAWGQASLPVPATAILFPGVATPGTNPTARGNTVSITADVGNAGGCVAVAWARLRIKAMSPVIFVHGKGASGSFFTTEGIAGAVNAAGVPIAGTFLATGIPTDTSINLPPGLSVAATAAFLRGTIPGIVQSFGVNSVHIVAHSKGGLDSRSWLSANAALDAARTVAPFRVISLSTLSTPHLGAAGADLLVALENSVLSNSGVPITALRALGFGVLDPGFVDLTTFAAPLLAVASPLPFGVDYRTLGGDVDANSNMLIQGAPPAVDEYAAARAFFFGGPVTATPGMDALVTAFYGFMFTAEHVIVVPIVPIPPFFLWSPTIPLPIPGPPSPNDILVTTRSAFGLPPYINVGIFDNPFGAAEHASIANAVSGARLIPFLRATDATRGDLR